MSVRIDDIRSGDSTRRKDGRTEKHLAFSEVCHRKDPSSVLISGKTYLQFCWDDYLGLSFDSRIKRAAHESIEVDGFGAATSASALGKLVQHDRLENLLCKTLGGTSAVIFSSPFNALCSILSNFSAEGDVVLCDNSSNQLIKDACEHYSSKLVTYTHLDVDFLERCLSLHNSSKRKLVIVESIFGNTGEVASLKEIHSLCVAYGAQLLVDESFGFGVLGLLGNGGKEEAGLVGEEILTIIGFDRGLGAYGAALVGSEKVCKQVREESLPYLHSVPLPSCIASGVEMAINVLHSDSPRRIRLRASTVKLFTEIAALGFKITGDSRSPIAVVDLNDIKILPKFCQGMFERGIVLAPLVHETQNQLSSKLRITVSSEHSDQQLTSLFQAMNDVGKVLGLT